MTLSLQSKIFNRKKRVKYFGVHVDNKLTWKIHIDYLEKNFQKYVA